MTKRRYEGIPVSHNREDLLFIQTSTRLYRPELIVELGTMQGGLTTALHDAAPSAEIATFDIDPSRPHASFVRLLERCNHIHYKRTDILGRGTNSEVLKYLAKPARKMLYCDNGNKLEELLLYAPHLMQRDLLGVHDWGTEIHTMRGRVQPKHRQSRLLYRRLRAMLRGFYLAGGSPMCRLWVKQ